MLKRVRPHLPKETVAIIAAFFLQIFDTQQTNNIKTYKTNRDPDNNPSPTMSPPFLHCAGHSPLPPSLSAGLKYKAIYR